MLDKKICKLIGIYDYFPHIFKEESTKLTQFTRHTNFMFFFLYHLFSPPFLTRHPKKKRDKIEKEFNFYDIIIILTTSIERRAAIKSSKFPFFNHTKRHDKTNFYCLYLQKREYSHSHI